MLILIQSHDGHRENWPGWHFHWKKRFSAAGVRVVFITEDEKPGFNDPDIEEMAVGNGSFALVLTRAIVRCECEMFLHILGDHWLTADITESWLVSRWELFDKNEMPALRIDPPGPYKTQRHAELSNNLQLYRMMRNSPYLSSFQPTFYRRSHLLGYLSEKESPWENETRGSDRIRRQSNDKVTDLYGLDERIVRDTMRRGKWLENEMVNALRREVPVCT